MAIRKGATSSQNKVISWALEPFEDLALFRKPNHVKVISWALEPFEDLALFRKPNHVWLKNSYEGFFNLQENGLELLFGLMISLELWGFWIRLWESWEFFHFNVVYIIYNSYITI
jgi:hypothetical protein